MPCSVFYAEARVRTSCSDGHRDGAMRHLRRNAVQSCRIQIRLSTQISQKDFGPGTDSAACILKAVAQDIPDGGDAKGISGCHGQSLSAGGKSTEAHGFGIDERSEGTGRFTLSAGAAGKVEAGEIALLVRQSPEPRDAGTELQVRDEMRRKEKGGQGREPWIEAAGNGHDVRIRVAGCGKSSVELGPHLLHLNGVVRHNGSLRPEKLLAKRRESRAFVHE